MMVRVAVYGGTAAEQACVRDYMEKLNTYAGAAVTFYENREGLLWGMELSGQFDAVIVHRSWEVVRLLRDRFSAVNVVAVAPGGDTGLYDVQPCYLIYEPVSAENLEKVMGAALKSVIEADVFSFHSGRADFRVRVCDILYFENEKRRINIVCEDRSYSYYGSMRELELKMEVTHGEFMRIQESYLVNPAFVREFHPAYLVMSDGRSISFGRKRIADIREKYMRYEALRGRDRTRLPKVSG